MDTTEYHSRYEKKKFCLWKKLIKKNSWFFLQFAFFPVLLDIRACSDHLIIEFDAFMAQYVWSCVCTTCMRWSSQIAKPLFFGLSAKYDRNRYIVPCVLPMCPARVSYPCVLPVCPARVSCLVSYPCVLPVCPALCPSVRRSVGRSVGPSPIIFKRVLGASCAVYPALFSFEMPKRFLLKCAHRQKEPYI